MRLALLWKLTFWEVDILGVDILELTFWEEPGERCYSYSTKNRDASQWIHEMVKVGACSLQLLTHAQVGWGPECLNPKCLMPECLILERMCPECLTL